LSSRRSLEIISSAAIYDEPVYDEPGFVAQSEDYI
jgi:hypothetical protein